MPPSTRTSEEVFLLGSISPDIIGEDKDEETGDMQLIYSFYKKNLPTKRMVLQNLFHLKKHELKGAVLNVVLKAVMDQVLKIWDMSKIPVMTTINATTKLKRLWEKWLNLQKRKNTNCPSLLVIMKLL